MVIYLAGKIAELLYSGRQVVHNTSPGQEVFIFIHQTHANEPHTNTFSTSIFPVPENTEERDHLLASLFKRKDSLHGYTRIAIGKFLDTK